MAFLDVVASSVYLKIKLHNLYGKSIIVNTNMEGDNKIYQTLQQDQGENKAMEIIVAQEHEHPTSLK